MECEICGTEVKYPKVIMAEGSRMNVCPRCVSHGTLLHGIQKDPTKIRKRSRYKQEEQFEIVDDYDKLIRDARAKRNWKQEELARKVNESTSVVAHLESGKMTPSKKVAQKFEKILGIKLIEAAGSAEAVEFDRTPDKAITLGDVVKIKKR